MAFGQGKIKEFFEDETEKIAQKIEKTPMEKFFLFFLILITISALVLSYLQFKKNIEEPLAESYLKISRTELKEKYNYFSTVENANQENATQLQNQDSDLDGLDDYSEIYVYQTSAYLEDSDADGVWDKQEIQKGTDPNCAEGTDCTAAQSAPAANTNSIINNNLNLNTGINSGLPVDINTLLNLESQLLSGEVTLEELGITDPETQKLFEQIKQGELTNTGELSQQEKDAALEALQQLTPAQIRTELLNQGVDQATLDQIDDAALQKIFLETLRVYK
jgi:hypothetical protein